MTTEEVIATLLRTTVEASPTPSTPIVLDRDAALRLAGECARHRIEPQLIQAVNTGAIVIPDDLVEHIGERNASILSSMVHLERAGLEAVDVLDAAGIDVRVMKGMATAHLDYPHAAMRQFGDVDLLVAPQRFEQAVEALASAGHRRKLPIRGGRWHVQHAITVEIEGFELDLHHRLLHQAAGHLAARLDLFASPVEFNVAGTTLKALPAPLRLLQASGQNVVSASTDSKHSSNLDVLALLHAEGEAYEHANQANLGWMLADGIGKAMVAAGLPAPATDAGRSRLDRYMSSTYRSDHPTPVRVALAEATVAPPLVTARTLWSVVSPGEEYLAARQRSRGEQLRRQLSRLNIFGSRR